MTLLFDKIKIKKYTILDILNTNSNYQELLFGILYCMLIFIIQVGFLVQFNFYWLPKFWNLYEKYLLSFKNIWDFSISQKIISYFILSGLKNVLTV